MKHLKPSAPSRTIGSSCTWLPGTTPPHSPTSTKPRPCSASALVNSAATLVVAGMLLSGMSMMVVQPPAAAARVALSSFPLGAPGLIDMHMRVDQARHHHQLTDVVYRRPRGAAA